MTLIVLYEYHTRLDLCRQDSWPQLSYSFHLRLVHRARPSTQRTYLYFLWLKRFQNEATEVSQRYSRRRCILMKLRWNSLPSRRAIVYHKCHYYCREMQSPHPWHSSLASSIWSICRLLNNSAWQARCLTLLNHSNKLKTQCTVFRDDLFGSDLFVFHIVFEFPPSLLGGFSFPSQRGGPRWWRIWRQRPWLLQRNPREAATCRRHFRRADQGPNYRPNGLLPYPVWKVVLFSK